MGINLEKTILSFLILPLLFVLLYVPATYSEVDPDAGLFMDRESLAKSLNANVAKVQRSVVHIITFDDAGGFIGIDFRQDMLYVSQGGSSFVKDDSEGKGQEQSRGVA